MKRTGGNVAVGNEPVQSPYFNASRRQRSATSQSPRRGSRRSSQSPIAPSKRSVVFSNSNAKRSGRSASPYYSRIDGSGFYASAIQGSQFKEIYVSDKDYKLLQSAFSAQKTRNINGETPALKKFKKTYIGYVTVPEQPNDAGSSISTELKKAKSMSVTNKSRISSAVLSPGSVAQRNSRSLSPKRQVINRKHSIRIVLPRQNSSIHQRQPKSMTNPSLKHKGLERSISCSTSCDFLYDEQRRAAKSKSWEASSKIPTVDKASQIRIPDSKKPATANKSAHCYFPQKSQALLEQSDVTQEPIVDRSSPIKEYSLHNVLKSRHFESQMDATSSNTIGENESYPALSESQNVEGAKNQNTHRPLSYLQLPSETRLELLGSLANVSGTEPLKEILISASEVIVVLMNTLFPESRDSSKFLARSNLFKMFVEDATRAEALEKARTVFESASLCIKEYADILKIPSPTKMLTKAENETNVCSALRETNSNSCSVDNEETLTNSQLESTIFVETGSQVDQVTKPVLVTNSTETLPTYQPQFQVTVSATPTPGFLHQTISGNDCEVKLTFMGTAKRLSSLIASTRSNSKSIFLSPLQTVETIHKSFSFIAGRLTVVKFHMHHISQQLGIVVQEYTEGKHGHYSKSLKRSTAKLQGLNTFSGIIMQTSKSFNQVFKQMLPGLAIWKRLREIFMPQIIQHRLEEGLTKFIPAYNPRAMQEDEKSITDIVKILDEIDALVELGTNSMASISSAAAFPGVKMKKSLRDIILRLIQAIEQMEVKQDIDLGALILAATWNTLLLAAVESADMPKVESWMLQSILANLAKIDGLVNEICNIAGRLHFVSGYLASKSLNNIKTNKEASRVLEDKKMQIRRIPWYKRRVVHRGLSRAYSAQSVLATDENGEKEFRGVIDTQSEQATIENPQAQAESVGSDHVGNKIENGDEVRESSKSSASLQAGNDTTKITNT